MRVSRNARKTRVFSEHVLSRNGPRRIVTYSFPSVRGGGHSVFVTIRYFPGDPLNPRRRKP